MHGLKGKIAFLWPTRIWQQIFLVLILLTVVPVVVLGTLLIDTSQRAVKTSVLRDHRELAVRAAGEVNEFVSKPAELLGTVAAIIGVSHADSWKRETAVVELSLRYPMFSRVASVDLNGQEIAISRLGSAKVDHTGEPAFQKARNGNVFVSTVRVHGGDVPMVTIAVPVTSWGKANGVLIAEVNLRGMWEIIDGIQVGETGYACVVDRSGILIAHPDKKMVLGTKTLFNRKLAERVLSGETGSQEDADERGRRWLVSYAPIKATGWGLVIFQSATEAYSFSKIMRVQSWILIALSILTAFFFSLALARFMSRPLNLLLEGTRRISQKDFDHPLAADRPDEIGQILASFNVMTLQLKEAQRAEKLSVIGKAATSIAHELKNSLVLVDTYLNLLAERYKNKEFIQEFSRVVPQEINAWKGMLQNMIDYARTPQFSMERMDVNTLIHDIATLAKNRILQHDLSLSIEMKQKTLYIQGNEEKLKRAVLNLLSNAFESTPPHGIIRIRTFASQGPAGKGGAFAVIEVNNNGATIPPEELSRIFEPFFTTKDGGLGLGLAICREIVERHRGFIDVVSGKETGTSFSAYLPLDEEGRDVV